MKNFLKDVYIVYWFTIAFYTFLIGIIFAPVITGFVESYKWVETVVDDEETQTKKKD